MKSKIPEPIFLSVPDAARLCGVSRNTLYTWVRNGKISAYQTPGRTNLIRPTDLLTFMQESGLFVPRSLIELAEQDEMNEKMGAKLQPAETRPALLIADDELLTRNLLMRMVGDRFTIFQAGTGYEALHLLTLHPEIKLMLLDVRMPGKNGPSTLREMSTMRSDIRVIIVTGYAGDLPESVTKDERVFAVLQKPVGKSELLDAIESAATAQV